MKFSLPPMKSRVERSQWLVWDLRGEVHCPLCLPCMFPSGTRWEERRKHVFLRDCPRTASFSHFRVLLGSSSWVVSSEWTWGNLTAPLLRRSIPRLWE